MQRLRFKHWSHGTDSCGQICTLKASALLRIHFLLHPFCLPHAHPHQSEDLLDNKPSSLPYFFFFFFSLHLGINLVTRTEKVTFGVAGSRLSVRLLGATSKRGKTTQRGLVYSSLTAEILLKRSIVGLLGGGVSLLSFLVDGFSARDGTVA